MISIEKYIKQFSIVFKSWSELPPWEITNNLPAIISEIIPGLDNNYDINNGIAIHKTARIEQNVIMKAPLIIGEDSFVGAHAYLRNGVYLHKSSRIGPGCEIKSSIIFVHSSVAHFNFIGDSVIGSNVNFEAGAVTANHYNERPEKSISVLLDSKIINIGTEKFGALIGDNSKIGANAVLSPGSILKPFTIVKRLELVDQTVSGK